MTTQIDIEKQKGIERERSRSHIERFLFKKMPDWVQVGPGIICLGFFALFLFMLYELYFSRGDFTYNFGSDGGWVVTGMFIIPAIWVGYVLDIENGWKKRWGYKCAVPEKERKVSLDEYWKHIGNDRATEYIFTDSAFQYYFYQGSKILFGIITISAGILAGILGLTWLSGTLQQTAPMTIIIFLLAMILWVLIIKKK